MYRSLFLISNLKIQRTYTQHLQLYLVKQYQVSNNFLLNYILHKLKCSLRKKKTISMYVSHIRHLFHFAFLLCSRRPQHQISHWFLKNILFNINCDLHSVLPSMILSVVQDYMFSCMQTVLITLCNLKQIYDCQSNA